MRLMYMADFHGNELLWRKFLTAQSEYKVDVSIIAGDLSAKQMVPIIEQNNGSYQAVYKGQEWVARTDAELEKIKNDLRNKAVLPYVTTMDEVEEITNNPDKLDKIFTKVLADELDRILTYIEEKTPEDKIVIVTPGNDDPEEMDEVIKKHERIIYPLDRAVSLPLGYEIISSEYTNPTPWNTPRECSEDKLWKMFKKLVNFVSVEWNKVIANFHCPPYDTRIDLAPKLDKNLKPVYFLGKPEFVHVGSKSVKKFIEKHQPLLGLHGHIHESAGYDRIKKSIVFNPGSEYQLGVFKAIIIDLTEEGIAHWFKIG